MKFIVERDNLLAALSFVNRYSDQRSGINVLGMVKMNAGAKGVSVTATDLDQSALDSFTAHVERQGAVCLSGDLLLKAVKSTDASEVQIDAGEKEARIQIGARMKMKLPVLPGGDFPEMVLLTGEAECNFSISADVLERCDKQVAFARSTVPNVDHWAQGTSWQVHDGRLDLCATNRKMLSRISILAPTPEMPGIIVPPVDLPEWDGEVSVSISSTSIRFSCGRQIVVTKLIDASYPEYRQITPEHSTKLVFARVDLAAAINRMAILSGKFSSIIILFVGRDGKLTLSARGDHGEITDEIAYEGDDFQMAHAHSCIAPVVQSFECDTLEWRIADHATPITIHDPKDDSRLAIAFPYNDARLAEYLSASVEAA